MNNINDVGDIIDEFFLKDDKKKIKNKFVITIKTDWDKFFPPKTWYWKLLIINKYNFF